MRSFILKSTNLLPLCLALFSVHAQSVFVGEVVDTSGQPVPFVHVIQESGNTGTIANQRGLFQIVIPDNDIGQLNVTISCIGYKPRKVELKDGFQKIAIEEDVAVLSQVIITPKDYALEVVEKAIKNIPSNYPASNERLRGFLREQVHWSNDSLNPLYVAESVLEAQKKAYNHAHLKGNVELIEGRKYESSGLDTLQILILAGSHHPHRFDAVAKRAEFLTSPKSFKFDITDTLRHNNTDLYEISFHHRKKGSKGKAYIVDSTFAIAKINFNYTFFPLFSELYDPKRESLYYEVSYYQGADKKWRLEKTDYRTVFSEQNDHLHLKSQFATTNAKVSDEEIPYLDRIQIYDHLLKKIGAYDSSFWNDYNIILPDTRTKELFEQDSSTNTNPIIEPGIATKTLAKKEKRKASILKFIRRCRFSYSLNYMPTEIMAHSVNFTNNQFTIDSSPGSQNKQILSLITSIQYSVSPAFYLGLSSASFNRSNRTFDLEINRKFNLNPRGRPILLESGILLGHQILSQSIGNFKSASNYRVNDTKFDSGSTDILLQQRGFRVMPTLSFGVEKNTVLEYFISVGYNFQLSHRIGLDFDETDQFFLKQKSTFLENGNEGLVITPSEKLFENSWNISFGVHLGF